VQNLARKSYTALVSYETSKSRLVVVLVVCFVSISEFYRSDIKIATCLSAHVAKYYHPTIKIRSQILVTESRGRFNAAIHSSYSSFIALGR